VNPVLMHKDLGLSLEQFAQFTDAEIIALSKARFEADVDAKVAEIDRILEDEPFTPAEIAAMDTERDAEDAKEAAEKHQRETAEQHLTDEQKLQSDKREATKVIFAEIRGKAEKFCRLVPRGYQGDAYAAILQALFNDAAFGTCLGGASAFRYPKITGGPHDFVIGPLEGSVEGWFPRSDVHLVGGPSGANKSTLMIDLLETQRKSGEFLGHPTYGLPYLILMADRGHFAHLRTAERMRFDPTAIPIKFIPSVVGNQAVQAIQREIERCETLPAVVFVEGCDMLVENASKMEVVVPFLEGLQRVAAHYHISLICSVGSPKMRIGEGYVSKRDGIFGTVAWSRKTETIINLQYPEGDDMDIRRTLSVLLRNGPAERYDMKLENGRLVEAPPEEKLVNRQPPQIEWFKAQTDWFTSQDVQDGMKVAGATADRYIKSAYSRGILKMKRGPQGGSKLYKCKTQEERDEESPMVGF